MLKWEAAGQADKPAGFYGREQVSLRSPDPYPCQIKADWGGASRFRKPEK
jgi:hypothetical protein